MKQRRSLPFWLLLCTVLMQETAGTGPAIRSTRPSVLLLSSYSLDWTPLPQKIDGLKSRLADYADIEYLFMDTMHVSEPESEKLTVRHLEILLAENPLDLVIASDDAALDFVLKNRSRFFEGIPVVFEGVNSEEKARLASRDQQISGIAEVLPLRETVELAAHLLPHAKRVVSITDGTASSEGFLVQLGTCKAAFPNLKFVNLDCSKYSKAALTAKIGGYGPETILLYMSMDRDGDGTVYSIPQALRFLSGIIRTPLFKADEAGLGLGIAGGCMISYREMGEEAGAVALEVLKTGSRKSPQLRPASKRYMFDYKQMERFGIPLSAIPSGSLVINRPPNFFKDNRRLLIAASIVVALLIVIIIHILVLSRRLNRANKSLLRKTEEMRQTQTALLRTRGIFIKVGKSVRLSEWQYDPNKHSITALDDEFTDSLFGRISSSPVIDKVPDSIVEIAEPQSRNAVSEFFAKVDSGCDASVEIWYRQKDSSELSCRKLTAIVERDEHGYPLSIYGIAQDITEQKREEERYQRELENMEQLEDVNLISKGHHNLSQNKIINYICTASSALHIPEGVNTYDTCLAAYLEQLENEKDRDRMAAMADRIALINAYQKGQTYFTYQYCRGQKSGNPVWIRIVISTFKEPVHGDIECFACAYEVSQKVLESQIFSIFFELGYEEIGFIYTRIDLCASFRLNADGGMKQASGSYSAGLESYRSQYFLPDSAMDTYRRLQLDTISSELEKAKIYMASFAIRNAAGEIRQKSFRFSWFDDSHLVVYYCLEDITEEVEEEQQQISELAAAKLEAEKANEAKSVFLSNMSHDLRTPLNGVLGFTDLALRENDGEKKQDYLQKAHSSGQLLLSLINDTLDLSRIESGKMTLEKENVSEDEINSALINSIRQSADLRKIKLEADFNSFPHEHLYIDKLKVQKIILNLLSNAVKYTQPGGTVCYSVEAIDPLQNGLTRRITIRDSGIGMSSEFLGRMYEPFSQEHRPEAVGVVGTGLGLSIVKKIIDLMKGNISCESEVGRGTTFVVELPLETADGAGKTAALSDAADRLAGKRVLLCEDNYLNSEIATLMLRDMGMEVDTAEDGLVGLQKFNSSQPGFYDAVLMDLRMPHMNGLEATQAIRALRRPDAETVPIIAMTADAFEEDIKRCIDAGMNAHIAKPINRDQLLAALVSAK